MNSKDDSGEESSLSASMEVETAEKLVKSLLRLDRVGPDELRELGDLAFKAGLCSLTSQCSQEFFAMKDVSQSLFKSTPIPV